jgi:hypothetical protein
MARFSAILNLWPPTARRLTSLLKRKRSLILHRRILTEDHASLRDTHMIKPRKFWSKHAEDTLLIALVMFGTLGVYLFAAYLIVAVL